MTKEKYLIVLTPGVYTIKNYNLLGLNSKGRFLSLPSNFKVEWLWTVVTNALAYITAVLVTALQSFVGPWGLCNKTFNDTINFVQ